MTTAKPQTGSPESEELSLSRVTILPPFPALDDDATLADRFKAFTKWLQATRPMRALKHWSERRGGVLAGGMAYAALFSVFAALLVLFSVLGLVLGSNEELMSQLIDTLSSTVPGLIGTDGQNGVVSAEQLKNLNAGASFTIAGIIALLSSVWTAMNFLNGSRLAIRAMFDLPAAPEKNMAVTRLIDLGLMIAGAIMLILVAVLVAGGSGLAVWLLNDILHLNVGAVTGVIIRVSSIVVAFIVNVVVVAAILRILSQIRIPPKTLWIGALIGAVLVGIIALLGSALLGGASSNPLIATFATILGVLIFFNFLCMVLLITAAWVKVTMDDLGQAPRILTLEQAEEIARSSEREAKRDRLATERIRLEHEMDALPRWRRRGVRRRYERVIAEQFELEHEIRNVRMGYDPVAAEADRQGVPEDEMHVRR